MNRREFATGIAVVGGVALTGVAPTKRPSQQLPQVNGARLLAQLQELSRYGENPQGGVSRVAYSEADVGGRDYVMGLMRAAGLEPTIDLAAQNVFGVADELVHVTR